MKIVITESQLKKIISENRPLTKSEYEERVNKSLELAKNYPNPRQFALDHPKLWYFIRRNDLLDLVFPNRKKYSEDYTDEKALKIASRYATGIDLELDYPSLYRYLGKNNLLKRAFPNADENATTSIKYRGAVGSGNDDPNSNPDVQKYFDYLMDRASSYRDMKDVKKRNPELYNKLRDLGHDIHFDSQSDDIMEQQTTNLTVPEQTLLGFLNQYLEVDNDFKDIPMDELRKNLIFGEKTVYPMLKSLIEKRKTGKKTYNDKIFNALLKSMEQVTTQEQRYQLFKDAEKVGDVTYNVQY